MKKNKKVENILLIGLFVFASMGAYVVFANSSDKSIDNLETSSTIHQKADYSNYHTAKPKANKREAVPQETVQ